MALNINYLVTLDNCSTDGIRMNRFDKEVYEIKVTEDQLKTIQDGLAELCGDIKLEKIAYISRGEHVLKTKPQMKYKDYEIIRPSDITMKHLSIPHKGTFAVSCYYVAYFNEKYYPCLRVFGVSEYSR